MAGNTPPAAFRAPRGAFVFWTWLTVVLSVGMCVMLSWLRNSQIHAVSDANQMLDELKQARVGFSKGFLYVNMADDPDSPYRREEGIALIRQAVITLEHAERHEIGGQNLRWDEDFIWPGFKENARRLLSELAAWTQSQGEERQRQRLRLRMDFHELDRQALQLDVDGRAKLNRLCVRQDRVFAIFVSACATVLCGVCMGIYVTGRALGSATRAFHEREGQLRAVGDHLPNGYVYRYVRHLDGSESFTHVSAGVEAVHGVTAEQCLRDPSAIIGQIDPDFIEEFRSAVNRSAENLEQFEMDLRVLRPDGKVRYVHVRSSPMPDSQGRVVWDGLTLDLTRQQLSERQLRKSEALLKEMGSVAKVGGWELDVLTGEGEWTEEVARIHDLDPGIQPNKALGLTFFTEESRKQIEEAIGETMQHGTPYDLELDLVSAKGVRKRVHTIGKPVFENGTLVQMRGSFQDITRQKEAEDIIRRQETRYRMVFNATNEAISLHELESGRVLDANEAFLQMFGHENRPPQGRGGNGRPEKKQVPYVPTEFERQIQQFGTSDSRFFEWSVRGSDGTRFWAEVSLTRSELDGQIRILAVTRDISERKSHELEIERLNRFYSMLSRVNQIIVRCHNRSELFDEFCKMMIGYRNLKSVWIGIRNESGKMMEVAHRTHRTATSSFPMSDWKSGCGMVSNAIRTGAPVLCGVASHAEALPCCSHGQGFQELGSCVALPLRLQGNPVGAFSICSDEPDALNTAEVRLLEEIAEDISFALERLNDQEKRLQAEAGLRHSEEQFRIMFETAAIGMAQADLETGRLLRVNAKLSEITGYSREELLQIRFPEITHEDDRQANWESFQRFVREESPHHKTEKRFVHKNGPVVWVSINITLIRDEDGIPVRTLATIEDVTERRLAEVARIRLTTAIEQLTELIVITDRQGRILYVNPAFEKTTGYARDEVLGRSPRILKSGVHDEAFYQSMWGTLVRGDTWHGRITNRKKDGTLLIEDATISPVRDSTGTIENFVAIKHDITREIELEAQILQAQKMETVGLLAGGVAHDFNNILAAIMMQAQLTETARKCPASVIKDMRHIRQACEHGASLTRQLLLFSRKQSIQPRDLNLNECVAAISGMLERIIGEDVSVELALHCSPVCVHADPGMINQLLLNLSVNARDAMNGRGRLTISTSVESIDEEAAALRTGAEPGEFACLTVSDTGCGIPAENLHRIYEPFFTTKDLGKGTGLGLATVYGIVKQHQGWIDLRTRMGEGTTFRIYLPATERPALQEGESTPSEPAGGTETILLAEDDQTVRAITRSILETYGYDVLEAENGVEALKIWNRNRDLVDLVLTDIMMPGGINGSELLTKIHAERPEVKAICFSGYSADISPISPDSNRGIKHLEKPFHTQLLLTTVRNLLDN